MVCQHKEYWQIKLSYRRNMKFINDTRGMELLEAAITTPIAIMVMLAIVNLGMLVYAQQAVQAAARHGARMGSVAQQCPACYAVSGAKADIAQAGILENTSVRVLEPGSSAGSILKIEVSDHVPNFIAPLTSLFPGLPGETFTIRTDATFRQEG
jgi:hypothetical protein